MTTTELAQELNRLIMAGLEDRRATIQSLPASLIEYDTPSGRWRRQLLLGVEEGSKVGDTVPLADNELLVFRPTEDVARVLTQLVKPPKPVTAVSVVVRTGEGLRLSTRTARAENAVEALRDAIRLADAEIEDALFKGLGINLEVRESGSSHGA
jgi:hypothetical protein